MVNHKYSTYTLIIILFGIIIVGALALTESEDIDEICNTANSVLRRTSTTWECSVTSYGELYYHHESDALTLDITSANNYTQITGMNISNCQGITCSSDTLTLDKNTTYMIDSAFSFTGGANSDYHCAIFLNGVEQEDCEFQRTMGGTANIGVATISCLKTGLVDATLDVRCQDTQNPAQDMSFYALNFNAVEVI